MGIFTDFLTGGGGQFLNAAANLGATQVGINQARQVGNTGLNKSVEFGQQQVDQSQFRPFTVSTNTGSVGVNTNGGLETQLTPQQQQAQQMLFGQGTGMLSNLGNVNDRTQTLFNQLSSIRNPEIERQRLGLEERLFNQGRSGLQTAQYGGSPEQFAMEKAIQEQQSQDLFNARGIAQGEQQQQYNIGSGLLGQSYMPEQQLLPWLQQGGVLSDIANTSQRQALVNQTALQQSGLEALLGGERIAGDLQQQQIQSLLDVLGRATTPQAPPVGGTQGWEGLIAEVLGGL